MKIDLDRLHQVHNDYPFNPRGQGKTFYLMVKAIQTALTGVTNVLFIVPNQTIQYVLMEEMYEIATQFTSIVEVDKTNTNNGRHSLLLGGSRILIMSKSKYNDCKRSFKDYEVIKDLD